MARAVASANGPPNGRVAVRKTYKLYIGGAFPRSESGRSYMVSAADGRPLANAPRASRKDLRDAVRAARGAFGGWADRTAMNRGQVLYRVAELMEGRREQFAAEVAEAEGLTAERARRAVDAAIDRWVWYAGWADKIAQVLGSSNPVAAPYFNFTIPEPTGVVAIVAPTEPALDGLVARLAPAVVGGNAVVVLASDDHPLAAIELAEAVATSDVPGGVVNVLTGLRTELAPVLAAHMDVNAIDVTGADGDVAALEALAAENVKRVVRAREDRSPWEIASFMELKTVWHPIGR
jgi:acyl-CoA reductase-like NAD-dependent aldehyde dehydrogenase